MTRLAYALRGCSATCPYSRKIWISRAECKTTYVGGPILASASADNAGYGYVPLSDCGGEVLVASEDTTDIASIRDDGHCCYTCLSPSVDQAILYTVSIESEAVKTVIVKTRLSQTATRVILTSI